MLLPREIFTAAQVREMEAAAVAGGVPGYTLMQRAGAAAFAALRTRWPLARSLAVVAGPGNNGGDGLVLARLAKQAGLDVQVLRLDASAWRGEAGNAFEDLCQAGIQPLPFEAQALARADVIVDALLGIGARAPLAAPMRDAILAINAAGRRVLAIDLPSGLDPDSGHALPAVRATSTITFIGLKQGLFLGEGPDHGGDIHFDALQLGRAPIAPSLLRLTYDALGEALSPRVRLSHKGQFGHVLVVGGGPGMPGAARLAGEAALRSGAGLVTVASLPEHLGAIVGGRPELMFRAVSAAGEVAAAMADADVIALGPGLGRHAWSQAMFEAVLGALREGQRLVLDADALNLLAAQPGLRRDDWVLTPHPGEAARLLGTTTAQVQHDRLAALGELGAQRGGIIVLKGAGTLIRAAGQVPRLCDHGNPGMSVPGMGDVLTGAVAALLAQCPHPFQATAAAVYAHAVAGDRCARLGLRGMLAQEVAHELRAVLAQLP